MKYSIQFHVAQKLRIQGVVPSTPMLEIRYILLNLEIFTIKIIRFWSSETAYPAKQGYIAEDLTPRLRRGASLKTHPWRHWIRLIWFIIRFHFREDPEALCHWGVFRLLQNCEKQLLASSCLKSVCTSVSPNGTTRLPLDGFSWNLIFEYFSKICRENSCFIKIWQ